MGRVLSFSDPADSRLGFLSNKSKHSFVIDGRRWHTVEHYIQGQRFRGTQMEGKIREASTIFQMKNLLKVRTVTTVVDGVVVKRKVHGDRRSMYKPTSINVYETMLVAIRAKFKQNRRLTDRLIRTSGMRLQDTSNPLTGKALEHIRSELLPNISINTKENVQDVWDWTSDVDSSQLTQIERSFVQHYIRALSLIIKAENADDFYPPMFYDIIANVCSSRETVTQYCRSLNSLNWTWAYSNTPNFCQFVYECRVLIIEINLSRKALDCDTQLASLIRWYRLYRPKELQRTVKKLQTLNIDSIKLGKGVRPYRGRVSKTANEIVKPQPPSKILLEEEEFVDEEEEEVKPEVVKVQPKKTSQQPVVAHIPEFKEVETVNTETAVIIYNPTVNTKSVAKPKVPSQVSTSSKAEVPQPKVPSQVSTKPTVKTDVPSTPKVEISQPNTEGISTPPPKVEISQPNSEGVESVQQQPSTEGDVPRKEKDFEFVDEEILSNVDSESPEIDIENVKKDPRIVKALSTIQATSKEREIIFEDIYGMLVEELEELYTSISTCNDAKKLREIFMV